MDRTSILGDTIDYVKELLDKINRLREENEMEDEIKDLNFMGNFKELKPYEGFVRNPPKVRIILYLLIINNMSCIKLCTSNNIVIRFWMEK